MNPTIPEGEQVKDTDILVVGGHEPTGKERAVVLVPVVMGGCVGHWLLQFPFPAALFGGSFQVHPAKAARPIPFHAA